MTTDEDQALLESCLAHDRRAWEAFVGRFSRLIYSVVHHTLRRHDVAHDDVLEDELFHESFLALYRRNYRKLRQWSGGCSLASWIRLVTASTVVDALRRRRPALPLPEDEGVDPPLAAMVDTHTPEQELAKRERVARLSAALERLPRGDRAMITMLYLDELPAKEVATHLGVSVGAIYTRKHRALGRLREVWADAEDRV